jgi:chemotaxis family two-component system response regulator Rcp1
MTTNTISTKLFQNPMNENKTVEILLVEDNPGDIRLTQEALKEGQIPHNLHTVMDGAEAIKFLFREPGYEQAKRPDLILLDLNLPKKDGRDVLLKIKTDTSLKRIPVVVLTTSNAESDILKAYDLHANCYITKPVDFNRFIEVIQSIKTFWLTTVRLPSDL